jgi:PAS domain S-box-containing protein
MKTAIVGGGKGCRCLLEFILERGLVELPLDVRLVCDILPNAPGVVYAAERGIDTGADPEQVFRLSGLELIIELTGNDRTAAEIQQRCRPGMRFMDHDLARIFWDLLLVQQKLEQGQKQTQKILDSIPDIIMVLDQEMRIQTVNAAFSRLTGFSSCQVRGRRCYDVLCRRLVPPAAADASCPFRQVFETGKRVELVQVSDHVEAPGIEQYFDITIVPLEKKEGKITQVVETLHPVNERVRLQREVEEAALRFRQFINSAHDLISIKDLQGHYQVVNLATANTFGLEVEDLIGKTPNELYPPGSADWISEHDLETIERGKPISFEETITLPDREIQLSTVRFPLLDYKGDVVGVCNISRDITEQRRLQQQLVQTDKLAAIGKLAAGVAHEINNPLTGILAYAEDLLENAEDNDERAEDYRVIIRETLRCRDIVRNLLDFARQTTQRSEKTDPKEVVDNTLALVRRQAVFKDIAIDQNMAECLPAVSGDKRQLEQVMLNLLVNAAEGMGGRGRIKISARVDDAGKHCQVAVADDGPGIPEDAMGRIFEPFFSTKTSSHGLGLAVSWGIVEQHGGRIDVRNREEGGTVFTVILPVWEGPS